MSPAPTVSAIVPALEEERCIVSCLERLRAAGASEVLVVDGGSRDATRELARPLADAVLECPGGLVAQLNRGAEAASGDVLLFQYADGHVGTGALAALEAALEDPRVAGGAFRLAFASPDRFYRAVALLASWRNRLGFGPFGDQSIFIRARAFVELGGFDPRELFADLELVRRLRRRAGFRLLSEEVVTSVRRWEENGRWRTLIEHWRTTAAYLAGVGRGDGRLQERVDALRRVR